MPTCPCGDPWTPSHRCTSGADLAAERLAAGLSKSDLARAWRCAKSYIGKVEGQIAPTAHTRAAYRAAIERARGTA